jgi:hypothetical protein
MSSPGLSSLDKEIFNLVEVFEASELPRAIERFINQIAAVVRGPHLSGWRFSQTTAKAFSFVAQFILPDLVGGGHTETLGQSKFPHKMFYKPTLRMRAKDLHMTRNGLAAEHDRQEKKRHSITPYSEILPPLNTVLREELHHWRPRVPLSAKLALCARSTRRERQRSSSSSTEMHFGLRLAINDSDLEPYVFMSSNYWLTMES